MMSERVSDACVLFVMSEGIGRRLWDRSVGPRGVGDVLDSETCEAVARSFGP